MSNQGEVTLTFDDDVRVSTPFTWNDDDGLRQLFPHILDLAFEAREKLLLEHPRA